LIADRAVADEQREVVHFARSPVSSTRLTRVRSAFADQVVVQAGDGEQRRDRARIPGDAAVGEDEDVDLLLLDHAAGHHAELLHRLREALLAAGDAEEDREHAVLRPGRSVRRILANSSLVRIGHFSSTRRQRSAAG
jgi:hypothetical protein